MGAGQSRGYCAGAGIGGLRGRRANAHGRQLCRSERGRYAGWLVARSRHVPMVIDYLVTTWPDHARIDARKIGNKTVITRESIERFIAELPKVGRVKNPEVADAAV